MKKLTIIAVSLLTLAACTKSSSSSSSASSGDTTFNGSYFKYSYSGNNIYAKAYTMTLPYVNYVTITTSYINVPSPNYYILLDDPTSYGTGNCQLHFAYTGTGTGTFSILGSSSPSEFLPNNTLYEDTSGTVTLTYSGTDYIQGTFSGTMYGSGLSVPVTGSFKIMH